MNKHILGVHWMKFHQEAEDFAHMERMQYLSSTFFEWMWANKDFCAQAKAVMPSDHIYLCRDHPLSEQWARFTADPVACGRGHADEWQEKVRDGRVHTPLDHTLFLGLNEPNTNIYRREVDQYNEAFCRRLNQHGLRACAYSFGVGHPSTVNLQPNTLPDWSWYAASAAAVLEGQNFAAFHEYGSSDSYGWGYWCDRLMHCPYPFNVIIQECGVDGGVVGQPKHGYLSYMTPEQYMPWIDGYMVRMWTTGTRKPKVHSIQPFTFDSNTDWHSFDIRFARNELERYQWTQPTVIIPPSIPVMYVTAPAGANIRTRPIDGDILIAVPYGDAVGVRGADGAWSSVNYRGITGWMLTALLGHEKPTTPPVEPPPTQDNWGRSIDFVLKMEGGYQNNPSDVGNWTQCAPGKGINKGTNMGISACSYPDLDIVNLTREQAMAIYHRDYWRASGADTLDWPLCLLLFDTAVLHGVAAAKAWLAEIGLDPYFFAAKRLRVYTQSGNWSVFGAGWVNRVAALLEEMAK